MKNPTIQSLCGVVLASVFASFLLLGATPALAQDFQVIVHEDRPEDSLTRKELSRLFLRQVTRWKDGAQVVPVDQPKGTPVRSAFLKEIHDKDEAEYAKYWVRLVFTGRGHPPDELGGNAGVLGAVTANPAAIGYVSRGTDLPDGVKVLSVTD